MAMLLVDSDRKLSEAPQMNRFDSSSIVSVERKRFDNADVASFVLIKEICATRKFSC